MYPVELHDYKMIAGPFNGTYGSVWIGQHKDLGWKKAFKRLHAHVMPNIIEEEAKRLQAVKSPYVIQIHEFIREKSWGNVLAMEFCPRGLDEHLATRFEQTSGCIPYDEARDLLDGILRGLDDAHAAGIIHGDIKPANVRFGTGANEQQLGLPKLSDFGAARRMREEKGTIIKGSTNWMAPELLMGGEATQQSDYFSFGILAYLVFSGHHPFYAADPSCL